MNYIRCACVGAVYFCIVCCCRIYCIDVDECLVITVWCWCQSVVVLAACVLSFSLTTCPLLRKACMCVEKHLLIPVLASWERTLVKTERQDIDIADGPKTVPFLSTG